MDPHRADQKLEFKFTRWREAVVWICLVFYVSDLLIDVTVIWQITETGGEMSTAWFVGFCILVPNSYAGYKSLQWYLRAFRDSPQEKSVPWLWLLRVVFFPLSLVLRYIDVLRLGYASRQSARPLEDPNANGEGPEPPSSTGLQMENLAEIRIGKKNANKTKTFDSEQQMVEFVSQSSEVAMLRLFVIFLEDAPICVVNLVRIFGKSPEEVVGDQMLWFTLGAVVAKMALSMTWGVVHFISITKIAWHAYMFSSHSREQSSGGHDTVMNVNSNSTSFFNNRASRKTCKMLSSKDDEDFAQDGNKKGHSRSSSDQLPSHFLNSLQVPSSKNHRRTSSLDSSLTVSNPDPNKYHSRGNISDIAEENEGENQESTAKSYKNIVTTIQEYEHRANLTPFAYVMLYMWQLMLIGTRLVMYSLFASMFSLWVLLLAFGRWIINTIMILLDVRNMSLANCLSFGGVYLFTFVSTSDDSQLGRVSIYYTVSTVECLTVAMLWWYHDKLHYTTLGICLLVSGLSASMFFLVVYYSCFHPNNKLIRSDKKRVFNKNQRITSS